MSVLRIVCVSLFLNAEIHIGKLYSCCLVAEGCVTSVSTSRNALHSHFNQTYSQSVGSSVRIQLTCSRHFSYVGYTHTKKLKTKPASTQALFISSVLRTVLMQHVENPFDHICA